MGGIVGWTKDGVADGTRSRLAGGAGVNLGLGAPAGVGVAVAAGTGSAVGEAADAEGLAVAGSSGRSGGLVRDGTEQVMDRHVARSTPVRMGRFTGGLFGIGLTPIGTLTASP